MQEDKKKCKEEKGVCVECGASANVFIRNGICWKQKSKKRASKQNKRYIKNKGIEPFTDDLTGSSKTLKSWLVQDDNGNRFFICIYCFKKVDIDKITIDHRHPKALGGKNAAFNYVPCCKRCNLLKENLSYSDFILFILDSLEKHSPDFTIEIPNLKRQLKRRKYMIKELLEDIKRLKKDKEDLIIKLMQATK